MRFRTRSIIGLGNAYRRLLALTLGIAGPRVAYAYYRTMARSFYRFFEPVRRQCEAQCQAALGRRHSPDEIARIAADSFVHRSLNLADLLLASRRINRPTYALVGGRIPEPYLGMFHNARSAGRPIILVTGYYGPFDLLPLLLGYNDIPASAVYKPHANPGYDAFRTRVRTRSGCEAVPVAQALIRLPQVLEAGGAVAILADHHAPRGVPVSFLGRPTTASRAVGLLAVQHDAVVAVAVIRRTDRPFRFEIVVGDFFDAQAWNAAAEPVVYVTERYISAFEQLVLADPAQYLWLHPRWGPGATADTSSADM